MSNPSPFAASFSLLHREKGALCATFFRYFGVLFLLVPLSTLFMGDPNRAMGMWLPILFTIGLLAYIWAYFFAVVYLYKKQVRAGGESTPSSLEVGGMLLRLIGVSLVREIALGLLSILFIIPGVIFSVYWSFALESLLTGESRGLEALEKSKQRVSGNWWSVFLEIILHSIVGGAVLIALLVVLYLFSMLVLRPLFFYIPVPFLGNAVTIFIGFFLLFFYTLWLQMSHYFLFTAYPLEEKKE